MTARELLCDLHEAGLSVTADGGRLIVVPAAGLTDELRATIRAAKPALLELLTRAPAACAANDPAAAAELEHDARLPRTGAAALEPAEADREPADWRAADAAYLTHHFGCIECKAAGRGKSYGERCPVGAALWRHYEAASTLPPPAVILGRRIHRPPVAFGSDERARLSLGAGEAELDTMQMRRERLARLGIDDHTAGRIVDKLLLRDRAQDSWRMCVECNHYHGARCGNRQQSGVEEPGPDMATLLQRCDGFKEIAP